MQTRITPTGRAMCIVQSLVRNQITKYSEFKKEVLFEPYRIEQHALISATELDLDKLYRCKINIPFSKLKNKFV